MKVLLFLISVIVGIQAGTYDNVFQKKWNLFKIQYNKKYDTFDEELYRMKIFKQSVKDITDHNIKYQAGEVSFEMGINQFADMLSQEVNDLYNGYNKANRLKGKPGQVPLLPEAGGIPFLPNKKQNFPNYVNWVEKGAVTPVRDQDACGSCYAFSGLGALESRSFISKKKLIPLSVQNIIDCSSSFGNEGCDGGLARHVYEYVRDNPGVNNETSYPYEAREGRCRFNAKNYKTTIDDYYSISYSDEEALKAAVVEGPVSVAIDAGLPDFKKYKGGIYKNPNCSHSILNHAVLAVGYGTHPDTKEDYWLIKNSWGTDWGEKGYFKLARNANNMCGVASYAVFPKV